MPRPPAEYGCFPNESQQFLLKAALLDGDEALAASRAWQARIDLDVVDEGSRRLLPLMYRAMQARGENWSELGRLRGIYRQTWYRNNLLIGRLGSLVATLEAAGVPTMVLKGVPLALAYYGNTALRPMSDADLLVPADAAGHVLATVVDAGWRPRDERLPWPPRFTASRSFAGPLGLDLDLHCHVLHESRGADADDTFWTAALPIEVGGVRTRMLHPSDQLLHIVAHGFRRSTVPPVRWLADATVLIRESGATLDWARYVEQARVRRLSRLSGRALRYLKGLLHVPIPDSALTALEHGTHGVVERVECWGREDAGLTRLLAEKWTEYHRAIGLEADWNGPLGFARFVRDQLGLSHTWQIPAAVTTRLAQRHRHEQPRSAPTDVSV
ncbi:MAG: nucleotidyltransferase family protein [Vicinamibacterales bacterium]